MNINEKISRYQELQVEIKKLEEEKKNINTDIFAYMKENNFDKLETPDSTVTVIVKTNRSWDKNFLKEKLTAEQFIEAYKETSTSSYIMVKKKGEETHEE